MKKFSKKIALLLCTMGILGICTGCQSSKSIQERPIQVVDDNYRNYYEVFVYSFYDSDGDGIGDLNGVTEKLDYIEDMGFNGIWLMPIMPSPTYHKYDVTDYKAIDENYGTMEDFETLIAECHKRNINVVIDFVINHTSAQHPWFEQATEYLKTLQPDEIPDANVCPYVDYYEFTQEKKDNTFYQVGNTSWYYEGSFWSEMPDLRLDSKKVQSELLQIADYWMDKGVDGFRMDAVHHYKEKDTEYNTEVIKWLFDYCRNRDDDFYMVSEVWASVETIKEYYASKTPSIFNFDLANAEGKIVKAARGKYNAEKLVEIMAEYQSDFSEIYDGYIDAPFVSNHDTNRISNLTQSHEDEMKFAAGLLLTMNGSPFVYYGEEIGMPSSGKKDENKRLPMLWSNTDPTGMTKGPVDADHNIESKFASAEEQLDDKNSILNYYKKALRLRNENPEIARGNIEVIESLTKEHQAVIKKTYEGSQVVLVYNTSDEDITMTVQGTELEQMVLCGSLSVGEKDACYKNGLLEVPGKTICILH